MKLTLYTETVIDSCHKLVGYDGNCSRLHGHSWALKVWARGDSALLDKDGILFDFNNVKMIKDKYDHRYINEIAPFDEKNPTAENISMEVYAMLKKSYPDLEIKIRLYETAVGKDTYCECGDW